jgi:hypothetical protein
MDAWKKTRLDLEGVLSNYHEFVDWECGSRNAQTLRKMLDWPQQLEIEVFLLIIGGLCELIPFVLCVHDSL